jgi:hypothetical protein
MKCIWEHKDQLIRTLLKMSHATFCQVAQRSVPLLAPGTNRPIIVIMASPVFHLLSYLDSNKRQGWLLLRRGSQIDIHLSHGLEWPAARTHLACLLSLAGRPALALFTQLKTPTCASLEKRELSRIRRAQSLYSVSYSFPSTNSTLRGVYWLPIFDHGCFRVYSARKRGIF